MPFFDNILYPFFLRKYFVHLFNTKKMHPTNFMPFLLQYFVHFFLKKYFVHLFNTKKMNGTIFMPFFFTIFCTFFFFLRKYFVHLFNNTKKMYCVNFIPILLSFFFDTIFYTYLIRLQTEYPNFHANSATLISM